MEPRNVNYRMRFSHVQSTDCHGQRRNQRVARQHGRKKLARTGAPFSGNFAGYWALHVRLD